MAANVQADQLGLPSEETVATLTRLFDLNFKLYSKLHLMRRVQQSMVKLGVGTLRGMESKLQGNSTEDKETRAVVFNEIVSSETSFFRDAREFEFFKSSVAPQLLRRSIARRQPARIWICGCSSGEEVYSMAMVLCEVMDQSDELRSATVRLFATDINEELLRQARLGEYADPRVDAERLSRFFTNAGDKYRASQRLRNMVMFGKHDVLRQTPYMNIDLLSCRNLTTLLTPSGRQLLFSTAHEALQDSGTDTGFLWLGEAEDIQGPCGSAFRRIDPAAGLWRAIGVAPEARSEIFSVVRESEAEAIAAWEGMDARSREMLREDVQMNKARTSLPWANPVLSTMAAQVPYVLVDNGNQILQSAGELGKFLRVHARTTFLGAGMLVSDLLLPELSNALIPLLRIARDTGATTETRHVAFEGLDGANAAVSFFVRPVEDASSQKMLVVFEDSEIVVGGRDAPMVQHMIKISVLFLLVAGVGHLAQQQLKYLTCSACLFVAAVFLDVYPNPLRVQTLDRIVHELKAKESGAATTICALNDSLENKSLELANMQRECSDLLLANSNVKAKLRTVSSELLSSNEELAIVNSEYVERIDELRDVNLDIENLLASTKIGVVFLDETLSMRKFTTAMTGIVPLTQQDIGRKIHVFNFDFGEEFIEVCEQVLSSTRSRNNEVLREVTHEDKTYLMRVLPYESGTGKKMKGVVATFLDISDRVLQKRDYARLIETANAPIFGSDTMGNVTEWNLKAAEITGYSVEEVLDRNLVEEFITPEYRLAVKEVLDQALLGEEAANFEFPLITKGGKRVEVLLNATSRRNAAGDIIGVVGIGQDITGSKEKESRLDLVAKDLTNLIDTANAPIFGIDEKGRVNEWNQKAAEITEFAKKEVMGRNLVQEFITPEYRTVVKAVLDGALAGKVAANFEFPMFTKAGRRVEILLNANPRRDTNNEIVGVVGVGQDITERIAQEQEYVRLIDTANAPIFGIDRFGNVNVWNKMAVEITKYSSSEVMGHNLVQEFITPDFRKAVSAVFDKALVGEEAANFEFPLITKYGTRVEVLLNATSRRDVRGDVIGVVGIGQDITGRKETEKRLDLVAKDLTNLIDTANAPIFGIDQLGRVNEWNQKAAEITEYSKDEVLGRNLVQEFITPEYRTAVKAVLDSALFGKMTANFEFPLYTKSGRRLQVLLNANPRRDTNNEIVGVVGVGQDITERLAQEQEYVRLIDTANAPIFGIDVHGNVNVWNRKAVEITAFSTQEVMGHNLVMEFITPDFRKAVKQVLDKAMMGEEAANFEFPLITKDGKRVEVLLNATSRRDARGDVMGVVGIGQDITGRKTTEASLKLVANDLTNLIDTANAPIFGIDQLGRVNEWNQKAAEITEYSKDEVMGRNLVQEFITPEYRTAVKAVLDSALFGKATGNFEFPLYTKSGRRLQVLLNANPRRDTNNEIVGVVGVGQDITARIAQEQEYVRLIDTANAPIFGIDRDGNVNVWNRKAVEITQYSSHEVMGHNLVNEFITPDYRQAVKAVFDKALTGEETANFEFPLITKDGKRVEVLLNATSRQDSRDEITGVMGIGQDITQFLSQQQEYTRLIENANAPIFGVDRSGCINIWNQKIAQVTGFAPSEVMGRNLVEDFIRSSEQTAVTEVLELALAGTETESFELPLQTQGKELVTLLLNASCKMDNTGRITGVVGVGQDFTARKKMEQTKTAFLASFSHELRTPLNGLLGMLELLLEQKLHEEAHRQVTLARTCSTLLLNLINDILDLSKIEAGQLEIAWQPFNLSTALEGAAQLVRMQAEARGIDLVVDIRSVPQIVVGDALRLRQVVLNLLSNAIKFTKEGTIWVRCWLEDDTEEAHTVRFEVEDTGVGMHASDCAKLFQLFTKISDTRVSNPAGSGLGLAICKQLVTLFGGSISVTSEYGSGSKFAFSVGFRKCSDDELAEGEGDDDEDTLTHPEDTLSKLSQDMGCAGASILVAEDNPFNLEVVRTFIEMAHMKCTWAPNGQRVLDMYKDNVRAFDLILMDCQMPILDGYSATRAIREFEKAEDYSAIPIVGLTAFANSGDREKCISSGMDNYLTKPIGKAALIRTIAAHKRPHNSPIAELRPLQEDSDRRAAEDSELEHSMMSSSLLTRDAKSMLPAKGAAAEEYVDAADVTDGVTSMANCHVASAGLQDVKETSPGTAPQLLPQRAAAHSTDTSKVSDTKSPLTMVSRLTRHTTVAMGKPVPASPLEGKGETLASRDSGGGSGSNSDSGGGGGAAAEAAPADAASPAAAEDPADLPPPIDEVAATKQFGSAKMFQMMLKRFASYLPDSVDKLKVAFEAKDFATLHAEGHSLKGSSSFIAAKRLCKVATAMQDICRPENVEGNDAAALLVEVGALMVELEASSAAVVRYLDDVNSKAATAKPVAKKKKKKKAKDPAALAVAAAAGSSAGVSPRPSPAQGAAAAIGASSKSKK